MSTYSLLQVSLDQAIERSSMEDASDAISSIARIDCAYLQRDLFGMVVSGLPLDEALAFQAELERRGFPTKVVADDQLPVLHEPFTIQRIDITDDALQFTDAMGRLQTRTMNDLVFIAGGFLQRHKIVSELIMGTGLAPRGAFGTREPSRPEREPHEEVILEFRLDFFFATAPNRIRASVSATNVVFFRGLPMQLRDTALIIGAMLDFQELLPAERLGEGLKRLDTQTAYPSLHSYEEEIRWHFYQLQAHR